MISVPVVLSLEYEVDTLAERVIDAGDGQAASGPSAQLAVENSIDGPNDDAGPTWLHTVE